MAEASHTSTLVRALFDLDVGSSTLIAIGSRRGPNSKGATKDVGARSGRPADLDASRENNAGRARETVRGAKLLRSAADLWCGCNPLRRRTRALPRVLAVRAVLRRPGSDPAGPGGGGSDGTQPTA